MTMDEWERHQIHRCANCENWDHCTGLCCDTGDYTHLDDGYNCQSFTERE